MEVVEQEWRGEVEEARGQVEELHDVSFKILYIQFFDDIELSVVGLG